MYFQTEVILFQVISDKVYFRWIECVFIVTIIHDNVTGENIHIFSLQNIIH